MAKMKIEVLAARAAKHGLSLRDRLVGYLPRYAGSRRALRAARQLAQPQSAAAKAVRKIRRHQRAARRCRRGGAMCSSPMPRRSARPTAARSCCSPTPSIAPMSAKISTPRCACWSPAAIASTFQGPRIGGRPLCCGRTFLSAGLVDHARAELDRLVTTYAPFAARGVPIVGLEPSCLLTLRDELLSLRSDDDRKKRQRAGAAVRGVSGARGRGRAPAAAARSRRRQGAGARPLPPEIVRRVQAGRAGASADSRSQGRDHRIQLLRHGRRLRLRRRHLSGLDRHGRAVAAAGGARRRCRHADRRRRHLVPAPDRRRHGPRGPSRRPRAGDEPRQRAQTHSTPSPVAKEPIHV